MTIDELDTKMSAEFAAVRAEMKTQAEGLDARVKAEGETTRRHFDVVASSSRNTPRSSPTASGGTPNGSIITNSESQRSKPAVVAGERRRIGWPHAR